MAHDHSFNAVAILREMQKARDVPRCGFCGKAGDQAGPLVIGTVPGPPAFCICHPCVNRLAARFIADLDPREDEGNAPE